MPFDAPPRPDPAARFWDRIADRYAAKPVADEAAFAEKLRITQGYLRPDMEVLELGCGTGTVALAHAPHVRRIEATDVSGRMIEIARAKAEAAGAGNVSFRRASAHDLEGDARRWDAVLALSLLHLLPDRRRTLAAVHDRLEPGGVLVASVATLGDSWRFAWFPVLASIARRLGLFPHVEVVTSARIEEELRAAGFEIAHRWNPAPGWLFVVARKVEG